MKSKIAAMIVLALVCVAAFASSAPWYKWKNIFDGTLLCAQTSPGEAWIKYKGPYMESRCRKPGKPQ